MTDEKARQTAQLGAALRSIRKERGWNLQTMSEVTGISVASLSKVENGKRSLAYDKLSQLATSLNVDIAQLFSASTNKVNVALPTMSGRRSIQREDSGISMDTGQYTYTYLAHDMMNKTFSPVMMDIHARSLKEFGELLRHGGEEYAYVLEGEIELHTSIYSPVHLKAGESIYFDSSMGHAFINVGKGPARVLNIASHIGEVPHAESLASDPLEEQPPAPPKRAARKPHAR